MGVFNSKYNYYNNHSDEFLHVSIDDVTSHVTTVGHCNVVQNEENSVSWECYQVISTSETTPFSKELNQKNNQARRVKFDDGKNADKIVLKESEINVTTNVISKNDSLKDKISSTQISKVFDKESLVTTSADVNLGESGRNSNQSESVASRISKFSVKYKNILDEWTLEQKLLSNIRDDYMNTNTNSLNLDEIRFIAGIDISFPTNKEDLIHACACVVILSYPSLEIIYKKCKIVHLTSVYIPEYLAFREIEPYFELLKEIETERPDIYPQVILVDGNGMLHPRKFGIASQLGVVLNIPTIGVAKKLFHVDGLEKNKAFKQKVRNLEEGSTLDLTGNSGFIYGKAMRSTLKSTNPIYISIGYKVNIKEAVDVVLSCCKVRVPEPIRWADFLSREFIRDNYNDHAFTCTQYNELNKEFLKLSKYLNES